MIKLSISTHPLQFRNQQALLLYWKKENQLNKMSSIKVSEADLAPTQTTKHDIDRHLGNFKPSVWGDRFLSCDSILLLVISKVSSFLT